MFNVYFAVLYLKPKKILFTKLNVFLLYLNFSKNCDLLGTAIRDMPFLLIFLKLLKKKG